MLDDAQALVHSWLIAGQRFLLKPHFPDKSSQRLRRKLLRPTIQTPLTKRRITRVRLPFVLAQKRRLLVMMFEQDLFFFVDVALVEGNHGLPHLRLAGLWLEPFDVPGIPILFEQPYLVLKQ